MNILKRVKKKVLIFTVLFSLIGMSFGYAVPVDAADPTSPLVVTLTSDSNNVFIGDTITYTSTIKNPSEFTIRDVTITYPINGEYLDIGTTEKDGVVIPNTATPTSMATVSLGDIKPNSLITISFDGVVNDNAIDLMMNGLPITVSYDYDYPEIIFDATASAIVSSGGSGEYGINDIFTEKVTISNNNLDQITDWGISGTLPEGLIVTRIYDSLGNTLATPNSATYSVSGVAADGSGYISGSDVWKLDGSQDMSSTSKDIYFDIKVTSIPAEGDVVIPFNVVASTMHSQYVGSLATQLTHTMVVVVAEPEPAPTPTPTPTATPQNPANIAVLPKTGDAASVIGLSLLVLGSLVTILIRKRKEA